MSNNQQNPKKDVNISQISLGNDKIKGKKKLKNNQIQYNIKMGISMGIFP